MSDQQQSIEDLQHIKRMMERSSRFISLSGLSGISAGLAALGGAWFAAKRIDCWVDGRCSLNDLMKKLELINELVWIAVITFIAALLSAFLFTWLRSKRNNTPLWGNTTLRLVWNTLIPLLVATFFLWRMMQLGQYEFVAPGCLLFYGLALVNASKYTLGEIRYLGYGQLLLGIINLWYLEYGLYFWTAGFSLLHIIYGIIMWWKYERGSGSSEV
jgi:hypothetical protein